jgi:transglutaminase-like putative cysteine protease
VARYEVSHRTLQRYREHVHRSRNEVRLKPIDSATQRALGSQIAVDPDAEIADSLDYYNNAVWMVAVETPHRELIIEVTSEVEVLPPLFEPRLDHPWDFDAMAFNPAAEYIASSPRVPRLRGLDSLLEELSVRAGDAASLMAANETLRDHFAYVPGATTVGTRLPEVLERRVGVCQDFAHVMLAVARQSGWPARYVSGYVVPRASETIGESHAWIEVGTPDGRWIGLDPTHGVAVRDGHIRVAVGRDYDDVAPVRGTFAGQLPGEPPEVSVVIRPLVGAGVGPATPAYVLSDQ